MTSEAKCLTMTPVLSAREHTVLRMERMMADKTFLAQFSLGPFTQVEHHYST